MGEFILNGRNYGGSTITPNPSDTPTDTLDSVKIGDTTYEIQGGGGGGLQYFIESENALYGINDDAQYMREDPKFRHTAPAVFTCYLQRNQPSSGYAVHTCPNVDYNDIVGIRGSQFAPLFGRVGGDGIFIISKDPTHCYFTVEEWDGKTYPQTGAPDYSDSYSYSTTHNVKTQLNVRQASNSGAISDTFTFNGETYYIVIDGQSWNWWTLATEIETEYKWFSFNEGEYPSVEDYYQTVGEYGLKIMQANKASTKYNGISKNDGLAFFAGASDGQGTNALIKIFDNGTAEGLATTADLALKQDKLIAGDNISIGSDGKTINAKVYANPTDVATEAMSKLKVGDTTYEIQGGGGGGSNLILDAQKYSLDEHIVGIWIDGKPLYEKTVIIDVSNKDISDGNTFSTGISDADYIAIVEQTFWDGRKNTIRSSYYASIPLYFLQERDGMDLNFCVPIGDKTKIRAIINGGGSVSANTARKVYITLRYTKTTDTAGSGGYQAYGFSPIIYSDVEREVGVWTDGKPLYQKTINCGVLPLNTSWHTVPHNISNIDVVVSVNNIVIDATNGQFTPIPASRPTLTQGTVAFVYQGNIQFMNNWLDGNTHVLYTTIQYTKTTDVAGSGEYNTLAIPNVHYSTDEQVIGTWIDGKTLYQKTLQLTSGIVTGSFQTIPLDSTYIVNNYQGFVRRTNKRVDNFNGFVQTTDALLLSARTNGMEYYIATRFTDITELCITVQYTKTTD